VAAARQAAVRWLPTLRAVEAPAGAGQRLTMKAAVAAS